MKAYKGFDKDLKCKDFQYEVGKEFKTDEPIQLCKKGFHSCENPHDVFNYYEPGNNNRFAEVKIDGVSDEKEADSKRVSSSLKIVAEISVFNICKIAVKTFFDNFGFSKKINAANTANAGDGGAANAGYGGAANAGDRGAANAVRQSFGPDCRIEKKYKKKPVFIMGCIYRISKSQTAVR